MYQATQVKEVNLSSPTTVTHTNTLTAVLDTLGHDFAVIRASVTLGSTATIASANGTNVTIQEADNTNSSNYATFTSGGITAGAVATALKQASQAAVAFVDLRARKRYLKLFVTPGTSGVTNEDATVAIAATLSRSEQSPHSTNLTDPWPICGSTNDVAVVG